MDIKSLLMAALQAGASHETIQTLAGMLDKQQAAERAFHDDLRQVREKLEAVFKGTKGELANYADLASVTRHLAPLLTAHRFGWHFETCPTHGPVTATEIPTLPPAKPMLPIISAGFVDVTCVLTHAEGHATRASMGGPIIAMRGNLYQGLGSAVTYMERYTLCAAAGLPATKDNDAQWLGGDDRQARQRGPQLPRGRAVARPSEREDAGESYRQPSATIDVEAAAQLRDMAEGVPAAEVKKWLKGLGADKYTAIPAARAQEARDTLAVLVEAAERRGER